MKKKTAEYNFCSLDLSRIAIIGCPGSGKTTFSKTLGAVLNREVVHLDRILWRPNWVMPEYGERAAIHGAVIAQNSWIIDGMWKSHLAERLKRATLVIFLDYKRGVCVRRALKRRIVYRGKQRDDIAEGCIEKLDGYFRHYIWTFRKKARPEIISLLNALPDTFAVVLKSPKQTERFLAQFKNYLNV